MLWLQQFAENRGRSSSFLRCRRSMQSAADQLRRSAPPRRNNVVSRSLQWVQSRVADSENEQKYFNRLSLNFRMSEGYRVQPCCVFELLGSDALIELLRALTNSNGNVMLCCFELRSRFVGAKCVRLSEKSVDDIIKQHPRIAADAERYGMSYLGVSEKNFVDLRNFLCGLGLIRSMIAEFGEDMRRCGLLSVEGKYRIVTREPLPENAKKMKLGPFRAISTKGASRMRNNLKFLLCADGNPQRPLFDSSECEKQLATFALDAFPILGVVASKDIAHRLLEPALEYKEALRTLAKQLACVESAPIVLCKWEAYAELAAVMENRTLLPNFLHLPNWRHFLAHCIKNRHYSLVRAHCDYASQIASWNISFAAQLAGILRVAELQNDCKYVESLLLLKSEDNANATVFELMQHKTLNKHAVCAIEASGLDSEWCDPSTGQTLLHAACANGDVALLKSLAAGMRELHFRWRGHDGLSPFHVAASCGNKEIMLFLLQQHESTMHDVAPCWHAGLSLSPLQTAMRANVDCATIGKVAEHYSREYLRNLRETLHEDGQQYKSVLNRRQPRSVPSKRKHNAATVPRRGIEIKTTKRLRLC